jgi:phosphomannomutase
MSLVSRDLAKKLGAETILTKVGNSNIKIAMKENGAQLGTEEANHYMFAETFYVESGILPVMIILELMKSRNQSFNQLLLDALGNRAISGDINIVVHAAKKITDGVAEYYKGLGGLINNLDGANVEFPDWHFCLRPSLNDPVVRLNLEAMSEEKMKIEIENIKNLIKKLNS